MQTDWEKIEMANFGQSCAFQFFQTILVQKDWKKFGMVKTGYSGFIEPFWLKHHN